MTLTISGVGNYLLQLTERVCDTSLRKQIDPLPNLNDESTMHLWTMKIAEAKLIFFGGRRE